MMCASAEPQSSRLIVPGGLNKRVPDGKVAVVQAELERLVAQLLKETASRWQQFAGQDAKVDQRCRRP
jgi:hypothetical protein